MARRPALLLFDLGGVLLDNMAHARLCHLTGVDIELDTYRERWLRSAAVRRFESGQVRAEAFAAEFIAEWQLPIGRDAFIAEFTSWPLDIPADVRTRLEALRAKIRTACLSNSNELHWQRFDRFDGLFDIALSSHELGVLKPDAAAFTRALEICGVAPAEVMFFDDSRSNVESALRLGLQAFHVEGYAAVERVLAEYGL